MSLGKTFATGLGHRVDTLVPMVYDQLRIVAAHRLRQERRGHTLQSIDLVHEAFIRLQRNTGKRWESASEFKAAAAHAMQQILVDYARRRNAEKRGGGRIRVTLDSGQVAGSNPEPDVLDLHEALAELRELDDRQYQVVIMRYYGGCKVSEIAEHLGVGKRTIESDWTFVRAWLHRRLTDEGVQS
jgi:RNA polymerase sigma factor (TIGR02999 family)